MRDALRTLPEGEVQEIVDELRSHVIDSSSGAGLTGSAVDAALAGLGPARKLAASTWPSAWPPRWR